jgi:hypothetical protein
MRRGQPQLKRLYRFGLLDLLTAVFAGAPRIIIPELEHRPAKMLDDVGAVKVDILHQRSTVIAVEDHMLFLSRRAAALDYDTDSIWWPLRRVRDIGRDEEGFAFVDNVIHDLVALPDAHLDITFELIEILLRIDNMKIVARVWTRDHHDEKITSVIKVTIAHRGFEEVAIFFNPPV